MTEPLSQLPPRLTQKAKELANLPHRVTSSSGEIYREGERRLLCSPSSFVTLLPLNQILTSLSS